MAQLWKRRGSKRYFPRGLSGRRLAGKAAVFKCTIHKIEAKELPALDDDFAKDVSEFDTLDEYKKEIKDNLTKKKEEQAKTEKENAVVDKAVENATMEIPEAMIDTQVENMVTISQEESSPRVCPWSSTCSLQALPLIP